MLQPKNIPIRPRATRSWFSKDSSVLFFVQVKNVNLANFGDAIEPNRCVDYAAVAACVMTIRSHSIARTKTTKNRKHVVHFYSLFGRRIYAFLDVVSRSFFVSAISKRDYSKKKYVVFSCLAKQAVASKNVAEKTYTALNIGERSASSFSRL